MEQDEKKIHLLAKVARSTKSMHPGDARAVSILSLAAASYGARPDDDSTVPTGFDPNAVALFECIVEAAYLVASADGVIDAAERKTFEALVVEACGGVVGETQVRDLVADLADQVAEDGADKRCGAIGAQAGKRKDHAIEVLRIAALIAQTSEDVSSVEREMLSKLASACGLDEPAVDAALADVRDALRTA